MRGEDLAKQAAATNKKGVVGRRGKIAPKIARPTKNRPEIFNNMFFNRIYAPFKFSSLFEERCLKRQS